MFEPPEPAEGLERPSHSLQHYSSDQTELNWLISRRQERTMIGDDRDILAHVIGYLQGLSDGSDPIDLRKLWLVCTLDQTKRISKRRSS